MGKRPGNRIVMKSRFVRGAAVAALALALSGCGWFQHRTASNSMVPAPKGPEAPAKPPDEAPVPRAAPQTPVQAAPLAAPPRR
jgi:hypothetical protein